MLQTQITKKLSATDIKLCGKNLKFYPKETVIQIYQQCHLHLF